VRCCEREVVSLRLAARCASRASIFASSALTVAASVRRSCRSFDVTPTSLIRSLSGAAFVVVPPDSLVLLERDDESPAEVDCGVASATCASAVAHAWVCTRGARATDDPLVCSTDDPLVRSTVLVRAGLPAAVSVGTVCSPDAFRPSTVD
jgi:hypothetical protein